MRARLNRHAAHSFVVVFGAVLVVVGAGFAAARTVGGPPWALPLISPSPTATSTATPDPSQTPAPDATQQATDAQAFFDGLQNQCGSAILGSTKLTGPATDPQTAQAYVRLADALNGGQVDHGVQGVRSVLKNCESRVNDGLRHALYHLGLNWVRHYEHELWLEQKFADKWPDGKPGGHEASSHGKPSWAGPHKSGKPDRIEHGNPHVVGGSSSSSHGHANGHSE